MFEPSGTITITTDYGISDGYPAVMEGVILSRFKDARIVRITDSIPSQGIREGAWVLFTSCPYFPPGTVHIAVVDPGVGTNRNVIVVLADGHLFICPDNGLVSFVLKRLPLVEARVLENMSFALPEISSTFHGRDIIAPTAAALASGKMKFEEMGRLTDIVRLEFPKFLARENEICGEVIYVDTFGNLITNIPFDLLKGLEQEGVSVIIGGTRIDGLSKTYLSSDKKETDLRAHPDSSGFLSISLPYGSARDLLKCTTREKVVVVWK